MRIIDERTRIGRGLQAGERLVVGLALAACACTSSGTVAPAEDASSDATLPGIDGSVPFDSSVPDSSISDAGIADATDASDASDAADAAEAGDAGCTWDGFVESPSCSTCLRTMCCGVTQACETNPACTTLDSCVNTCSTNGGGEAGSVSNCEQACADDQPQAVRDEYQAWSACVGSACGASNAAGPCF